MSLGTALHNQTSSSASRLISPHKLTEKREGERTWTNEDIRQINLSPTPDSRSGSLDCSPLKELDEPLDGVEELFSVLDLCVGVLSLEIAVEGGDEGAVYVVCLEADEGAGVYKTFSVIDLVPLVEGEEETKTHRDRSSAGGDFSHSLSQQRDYRRLHQYFT